MTSIFESLREFAFKGWPNRSNCRCEDHEPVELPPDKWFDGKWYRNHFTHPPLAEGGLGFASWLLSRIWNHWKERAPPAHTAPLNLPRIRRPAIPANHVARPCHRPYPNRRSKHFGRSLFDLEPDVVVVSAKTDPLTDKDQ